VTLFTLVFRSSTASTSVSYTTHLRPYFTTRSVVVHQIFAVPMEVSTSVLKPRYSNSCSRESRESNRPVIHPYNTFISVSRSNASSQKRPYNPFFQSARPLRDSNQWRAPLTKNHRLLPGNKTISLIQPDSSSLNDTKALPPSMDSTRHSSETPTTSDHDPQVEFQRPPSTDVVLSNQYDEITPESLAWVSYQHIKQFIPNLSPLQHPSIYDIDPQEYLYTSYEPRGPRSLLFWNLWSALNPNIRPIDLYKTALQHGVQVCHRVPIRKAFEIFPHRHVNSDPSIPLHIHDDTYQEALLVDCSPHILNKTYLRAVKILLARENARGFVERGGLAWRLAIEFGTPDLWSDTFRGPSLRVVRFYQGELMRKPEDTEDWICEKAFLRESQLLVGTLFATDDPEKKNRKSLFPPLELFETSMHWNGAWTNENESWFRSMVSRLHDNSLRPKTVGLWDRWARSHIKYITNDDADRWNKEAESFADNRTPAV
jgi:hypothetical protein